MENHTQPKQIYFLGIGGIGMSAIARYYMLEGASVAGYDRTETALTRRLAEDGARIHYTDDPALIEEPFRHPDDTLVVYTPALPHDHAELGWFRSHGFRVLKRSEILGILARDKYVMAVAGTHGKTTTTTLTAWLNHTAGGGGSAFLGGISKNFDNNFVYGAGNRLAVEADEFDRSFLHLWPDAAVITAADADHLDIYGTLEELHRAFAQFAGQIRPGGTLILKKGVSLPIDNPAIRIYSYACTDEEADFHAANLRPQPDGTYRYDIVCPDRTLRDCRLGIPGIVNVENSVAAVALLWTAGFDEAKLKEGLESFRGVRRRFDFHLNTPEVIYMDDYAHHPAELRAALTSMRRMFPHRRITAIFQPHLYSRTQDFYREFAESLSLADEVILAPIYPAREEPIPGVTSQLIADRVTVPCRIVPLDRIPQAAQDAHPDILITFGAGNIENCVEEITRRLTEERLAKR